MTGRARFEDRVVVVSGGAMGIGAASARAFAREGARVYVADVDGTAGERTAADVGGTFLACDVRDERAVSRLFDRVSAEAGAVDVVHANAGIELGRTIADTELADWERVIGVNLTGVYLVCRFTLRQMLPRRTGAIVITSSPHAINTVPDAGAYAASKGGVLALTRALALEAAPHDVRVNALLPGAIDTPMLRREAELSSDPEGQLRRFAQMHPLRRLGTAEEVAACALFLASDEAAFVTGTALAVDGGVLAAQPSGPPISYGDR